jgi:hypothetical protein
MNLPHTEAVIILAELIPSDQVIVLAVEKSRESPLVAVPLTLNLGLDIGTLRLVGVGAIALARTLLSASCT